MQNLKYSVPKKIVLIGASTGGPGQIEKIISSLPALNDTCVVIAQHMAMDFIPSFAKRLQEHSVNPLNIADNNTQLKAGNIYLCFGITFIENNGYEFTFKVAPAKEHKFNPDINTLFNSFISLAKDIDLFCIILTGIGSDGVEACKQLSIMGAKTATQTESSAIVDGMTSRARAEVPNIEVLDVESIKNSIREFCS